MESYTYKIVLLIDDDTDNLVNSRVVKLSCFALQTLIKDSAIEALNYLNQAVNNPGLLPDIIFLDINMPHMNGFGFLASFEQLPTQVKDKIKIIMLSSSLDKSDMHKAESNPYVYKYIAKPLTIEALTELPILNRGS